jgi:hypothetical protein
MSFSALYALFCAIIASVVSFGLVYLFWKKIDLYLRRTDSRWIRFLVYGALASFGWGLAVIINEVVGGYFFKMMFRSEEVYKHFLVYILSLPVIMLAAAALLQWNVLGRFLERLKDQKISSITIIISIFAFSAIWFIPDFGIPREQSGGLSVLPIQVPSEFLVHSCRDSKLEPSDELIKEFLVSGKKINWVVEGIDYDSKQYFKKTFEDVSGCTISDAASGAFVCRSYNSSQSGEYKSEHVFDGRERFSITTNNRYLIDGRWYDVTSSVGCVVTRKR